MTTKTKKTPAENLETLTEAAEKVVETVAETSREAMETMAKAGSEAFAGAYDTTGKFSAEQMGKSSEMFDKTLEMGKQNLQTMTAVMTAMTSGMEAYNSRLMENWMGVAAAKMACYEKMMGAKTPQDVAAAQIDAVKKMTENTAAETMELNRIAVDTMTKVAAPMKARFEQVMETAAKP